MASLASSLQSLQSGFVNCCGTAGLPTTGGPRRCIIVHYSDVIINKHRRASLFSVKHPSTQCVSLGSAQSSLFGNEVYSVQNKKYRKFEVYECCRVVCEASVSTESPVGPSNESILKNGNDVSLSGGDDAVTSESPLERPVPGAQLAAKPALLRPKPPSAAAPSSRLVNGVVRSGNAPPRVSRDVGSDRPGRTTNTWRPGQSSEPRDESSRPKPVFKPRDQVARAPGKELDREQLPADGSNVRSLRDILQKGEQMGAEIEKRGGTDSQPPVEGSVNGVASISPPPSVAEASAAPSLETQSPADVTLPSESADTPSVDSSPAAAPVADSSGVDDRQTSAALTGKPTPMLRGPPKAIAREPTPAPERPVFKPRAPVVREVIPPGGAAPVTARLVFRPKSAVGQKEEGDAQAPAASTVTLRRGPVLVNRNRSTGAPAAPGSAPPKAGEAPARGGLKPAPKGKDAWKAKSTAGGEAGAKRRVVGRGKRETRDVGEVLTKRRGSKASRKAARAEAARANAPVKAEILEVGKAGMSVQDLAEQLAINDSDVVRTLFIKGIASTVNQTLDEAAVRIVCEEYEVEVIEAGTMRIEDLAKKSREFLDEEDEDDLVLRPPVVTIMGHVDHGKTSLLDYIRKAKVAAGEAGGITQAIGAYRVKVNVGEDEHTCVFLDTPGHEAFSAMRARGARVTDIAIIVVAADDGVRPQSLEAIAHARAAGVPICIAINKIDKEGANKERVMQELASHNLMPEEWGGDVPMVAVSAKSGENIDALLEAVMLLAEFQELKANPNSDAMGTVIEASLDRNRGPVATLLIQNGTLSKGDVVLCGEAYGKVRALVDDTGSRDDSAGPSMAVEILGLNTVPVAGDEFQIVSTLDEARVLAEEHAKKLRSERLAAQQGEGKVTLANLATAVAAGMGQTAGGGIEHHQVNLVLKVDVQGSLEAIRDVLAGLPQDTVNLRILLQAPGEITSSDIDLAAASEAIVLGFNVLASPAVEQQAEVQGVEIRTYRVIYDLVDDMRKAMEGMLETVEERIPLGQAEVRAVFGTGSSKVAGCMVTEGKLVKGCGVSVRRGKKELHAGILSSLRRVKEAAKEVAAGLECGLGMDGFNEWSEGDIVEAYTVVAKNRSLEDASVDSAAAIAAKTKENASMPTPTLTPVGNRR
eukprot:jgi/Mesen1/4614/ME000234S03862